MAEQFSFPGFDDVPPPQHKPAVKTGPLPYALFFSLFPTSAEAAEIAKVVTGLLRVQGITSKPQAPHRLHVTLHNLGNYSEVPQNLIAVAIRAGDALAADAFDVAFDRALSYPSSRAYVLSGREGCQHLVAFRGYLGEAMRREGLRVVRSFTPHMTVVYDRKVIAESAIEPVRWRARQFFLIRSHVGLGRYDLLGSWPLHGSEI